MLHNVFCLKVETVFQRVSRWHIQARYAFRSGGDAVILPAGTWLLELGLSGEDGAAVYGYRTAAGEVVVRQAPLGEQEAEQVQDLQAVISMNAYRSLADGIRSDLGLSLERIANHLAPFALVRCPICSGTDFDTLELAGVWCRRCNTRFETRFTGGDPGVVVDASYEHLNLGGALYLLPPASGLLSTLVLKDSGDPRDMDTQHCGCTDGTLRLTDGVSGLRAGLHACQVGTLYDWGSIYGHVPLATDLPDHVRSMWNVDGVSWPDSATERVLPLSYEERAAIETAARMLSKDAAFARGALEKMLSMRREPMAVFKAPLPPLSALGADERYMLHHWLPLQKESSGGHYTLGIPVWYVVKAQVEDRRITGWDVVRKDICPMCGKRFSPEHADARQYANRWEDPHGWCREDLAAAGWTPTEAQPVQSQS